MRVHEIQGGSIREALERARDELGGNAVVVTQAARRGGGVRLAVAERTPRSGDELELLRERARALLAAPEREREPSAPSSSADVERCLRATGSSEALVARVAAEVDARLDGGRHPLDVAAEALGRTFHVARAERAPGSCAVMAFVGPSGVGKTTTIAKLGARLVRAGRRVALATFDAYRVGAVAQLRAHAALLRAPVLAARDVAGLLTRLEGVPSQDVILLDATGALERDRERLLELATRLPRHYRLQTYLVLAATSGAPALERVRIECDGLALAGCVVTKLDETRAPAPVLEHAHGLGLPIAFLSDGADLARSFHRPTGEHFADLLLRGRLA